MPRKPNTVGGGAQTNVNGLSFEGRTDLREAISNHPSFVVAGDEVRRDQVLIGQYYEKHGFYTDFLSPRGVNWRGINSKKYLPDSAFFNELNQTLYIIEKKYQASSGSVDEKLQTCDFKKKVYKKLVSGLGIRVEYYYLLNDWFDQPVYEDVFSYINSVGCKYFIDEIDLKELGLS